MDRDSSAASPKNSRSCRHSSIEAPQTPSNKPNPAKQINPWGTPAPPLRSSVQNTTEVSELLIVISKYGFQRD